MAQLGAEHAGTEYFDIEQCWTVDYALPKGKVWARHGEHMSWTREYTLTDCWKDLIDLARGGVVECENTCDCRNWEYDNDEPSISQITHQLA
jgi:hypothetical protein